MNSKVTEKFLRYIKVNTVSSEESDTFPSTNVQFDLLRMLEKEMKDIGISNVRTTKYCYVYGEIPATKGYENVPKIGFNAHMDTSPDASGENVNPQIFENYDGKDLYIGNGRTLTLKDFPHLPKLKGKTLITTDGSTLLGADDKAGIAEIMTFAETIISENIPHGKICICFSPDEEIGMGPKYFDVEGFGADFGYTVDGGEPNQINYENFNASAAKIEFVGKSVHPGSSKNVMVNAALLAKEFDDSLPKGQTPRDTENYEGFWHLTDMRGDVSNAELKYIIRDHDMEKFLKREQTLKDITKTMNDKYGEGTVTLTITEQYRNMIEKIKPCMHLIDNAKKAIRELGMQPETVPIRGGTDGAQLSFKGLPCPNLGTGGYACHGPYEHITVEGLETVVKILLKIEEEYSKIK